MFCGLVMPQVKIFADGETSIALNVELLELLEPQRRNRLYHILPKGDGEHRHIHERKCDACADGR